MFLPIQKKKNNALSSIFYTAYSSTLQQKKSIIFKLQKMYICLIIQESCIVHASGICSKISMLSILNNVLKFVLSSFAHNQSWTLTTIINKDWQFIGLPSNA